MNIHRRWLGLIPHQPRNAGEVVAVHSDGVTVELPSGAHVRARGSASLGDQVYLRGDVLEGPAPSLTGTDQSV